MDEGQARAAELAAEMSDVLYAVRLEPDLGFEFVSPSVERLVGYTPQEHYDDPGLGSKLVDPRDTDVLAGVVQAPAGRELEYVVRWVARDGDVVWTQHRCRKESRDDGSVVLYGAARDVTAQKHAEERLRETEELYRLLAENSLDVVYRADLTQVVQWVSPSVTEVLGWTPEEFVGRTIPEIAHADDLVAVRNVQAQVLAEGGSRGRVEMRFATRSGGWRWMRVNGRVVRDADGEPIGGIDVLRDIQSEVDTRDRLQHEVEHDALTGLVNRGQALLQIEGALARGGPQIAVLAVALDDLTTINDALTYAAGDRVLSSVAERLVAAVGSRDLLARTAGNEFVVVMPSVRDEAVAATLAMHLMDAVRGSVRLGAHDLETTISIGIAVGSGGSAEGLLSDASTALHQAKLRGHNRWEFLDSEVSAQARDRILGQSRLRDALAAGRIQAWFQPVVSLPDGAVCGYEALARWIRDDGSVGEPSSFISTAERTDLIVEVDRAVLRDSLDLLRRDESVGFVSVNVSAQSLASPDLVEHVLGAAFDADVAPSRVRLELTETSLVHVTDAVKAAMNRLDAAGARWYVDDFGTGYSSITHLRDLPVAGLKLDRSFTATLSSSAGNGESLTLALAGLAHGLKLDTVAEGVETRAEAETLTAQGWRYAQGWLFGRPVPISKILADQGD